MSFPLGMLCWDKISARPVVLFDIYARFGGKPEFGFGEICVWFLEEFEFGFGAHPRLVFVTILRLVFWRVHIWFFGEFAFGFCMSSRLVFCDL